MTFRISWISTRRLSSIIIPLSSLTGRNIMKPNYTSWWIHPRSKDCTKWHLKMIKMTLSQRMTRKMAHRRPIKRKLCKKCFRKETSSARNKRHSCTWRPRVIKSRRSSSSQRLSCNKKNKLSRRSRSVTIRKRCWTLSLPGIGTISRNVSQSEPEGAQVVEAKWTSRCCKVLRDFKHSV